MQDFDAQRRTVDPDRAFKILGQTFEIKRRVRPEVLKNLKNLQDSENIVSSVDAIDSQIRLLLKGSDVARWDALRAQDDEDGENLLTVDDLADVMNWALSKVTDRPLGSPASSQPSSTTTAPTSPAASPSPGVPLLASVPANS